MKDYYKTLGMERESSPDSITRRFKELAFENHPDVSDKKDAGSIFIEIYEAYHILNNPEKKRAYDLLYDKYIGKSKSPIPDEENLKADLQTTSGSASEIARQKAKKRYRELIREMDCFFIDGLKADGQPLNYNMHRIVGISGGTGPMGSIKSRTVSIPIPRSRRAGIMHLIGFSLKVLFFIIAIISLKYEIIPDQGLMTNIIISLSLLLVGGVVTLLFYQINKTRSKFFFSHNYFLIKKYKKNGYRRGFHPIISTTPAGAAVWLLRLIF